MKKGKQLGMIIGGVVVIAAAGAVGKNLLTASTAGEENIAQIGVVNAQKGTIEEKLDTSGTVVSDRIKVFFSPVNATVEKVNFKVGDTVKEGDKLVTFDLKDLENQNQKAQLTKEAADYGNQDTVNKANKAAAQQAEAAGDAATLQSQVDQQEQVVENLKQAISQAGKNAKKEAEQKAQEAKKKAQKAYEKASREYQKQLKAAQKAEADCQNAVNTAQASYNTAKTEYDIAFAAWNSETDQVLKGEKEKTVLEKNAVVSTAQALLNDTQNKLAQASESKSALESNPPVLASQDTGVMDASGEAAADTTDLQNQLETASSKLAELQSELASKKAVSEGESAALSGEAVGQMEANSNLQELENKSIQELIAEGKKGIHAEFNGVISESQAVEGSSAAQGGQLFTLQSTDEVSVDVTVSKYDYEKVKEGQRATVTLAGKSYEGTVARVNRIASPNEKGTPVIGVNVHINEPDENIFIGVEAKVQIFGEKAENALLVPVEAVNTGNDGSFCYVLRDQTIEKQTIETGISSDDSVEVTEGLREGDQVIPEIGSLAEGDRAMAADETESPEQ